MDNTLKLIVDSIVRDVINERLEIENYLDNDKIDEIVKELIVYNSHGGGFTEIEFMGEPIEVYVTDSEQYSGNLFAYSLSLYFPRNNPDFNRVKEMLVHELTHKINDKLPKRTGWYFPGVGDYEFYINKARDILYRLWNRDERIAYLTRSINGVEESRKYIERLRGEIDYIEENPTEEIGDELERMIWQNMISKWVQLPPKDPFAKKNYFIKKSRYLLSWFERKLMKNAYRFNKG